MTKKNEEEPKIVLQKQSQNPVGIKPIYVDIRIWNKLRDLKEETGISISKITNKFLLHGLKYVEIIDNDVDREMEE